MPVRQLHVPPHLPLVLVANVARLERVGAGANRQQQVDDVAQRDVGEMRAVPAPPAHVIADAILGDAVQRVVERLDAQTRVGAIFLERHRRVHRVPVLGHARIVDLQDEAGVGDRAVLDAQRVGDGEQELFLRPVVAVLIAAEGSRRG